MQGATCKIKEGIFSVLQQQQEMMNVRKSLQTMLF
jgi:hypothetical protein